MRVNWTKEKNEFILNNFNKKDNRIDNLELMTRKEHIEVHRDSLKSKE